MSVTVTDLETLIRKKIRDTTTSGVDVFEYLTSAIFTISEDFVISVVAVYVNGVESGVTYTYDSSTNKVTITSSLTAGDSIEIRYTYYQKYSSTEVSGFITSALLELSTRHFGQYEIYSDQIYPEVNIREKNLIVNVTAIMMEPENKTIRTPDMTIVPAAGSMTVAKMIDRLVAIYKKDNTGYVGL